jgi:hypothetical protein
MSELDSSVNGLLNKMRSSTQTGKGTFGEQAVFKICEQFYQREGGILIHSYSYKTDKSQAGNIKKGENGQLYVENLGDLTEIDVLYVSKYRVFPIEVKAYKAKEIRLDDEGIYGCYKTDKSPVHQNEMHCRHLYPFIYRALPDGDTRYIIPLVCMVDKCNIIDDRKPWQKEYIKLCVLNNLEATIAQYNTPLDYKLNLQLMDNILREALIKQEKYLPPRF